MAYKIKGLNTKNKTELLSKLKDAMGEEFPLRSN